MRRNKAVIWVGFKVALTYRFDFLVTIFTSPINLIVFYSLWKAIFAYGGQDVINGYTFDGMVSYYVISMIIGFFTWSNVERWMEYDIIEGDMVVFFLRPIRLLSQYLCFEIGLNLLGLLMQVVPIFILGFFFFSLQFASVINLLLFLVSLVFASVLYFMMGFLLGLGAFWFKRITGISKAKGPVIGFLSGALLPLTFFPAWAQNVLAYLPFMYVRFVPIQIYLGNYGLLGAFKHIGIQVFWIAAFASIALLVEKRAFKKFAGAGV